MGGGGEARVEGRVPGRVQSLGQQEWRVQRQRSGAEAGRDVGQADGAEEGGQPRADLWVAALGADRHGQKLDELGQDLRRRVVGRRRRRDGEVDVLDGDHTTGTDSRGHGAQRLHRVREVPQQQPAVGQVESAARGRQPAGVRVQERDPCTHLGRVVAGDPQRRRVTVDAHDPPAGPDPARQQHADLAMPAPHVQAAPARPQAQPGQERLRARLQRPGLRGQPMRVRLATVQRVADRRSHGPGADGRLAGRDLAGREHRWRRRRETVDGDLAGLVAGLVRTDVLARGAARGCAGWGGAGQRGGAGPRGGRGLLRAARRYPGCRRRHLPRAGRLRRVGGQPGRGLVGEPAEPGPGAFGRAVGPFRPFGQVRMLRVHAGRGVVGVGVVGVVVIGVLVGDAAVPAGRLVPVPGAELGVGSRPYGLDRPEPYGPGPAAGQASRVAAVPVPASRQPSPVCPAAPVWCAARSPALWPCPGGDSSGHGQAPGSPSSPGVGSSGSGSVRGSGRCSAAGGQTEDTGAWPGSVRPGRRVSSALRSSDSQSLDRLSSDRVSLGRAPPALPSW